MSTFSASLKQEPTDTSEDPPKSKALRFRSFDIYTFELSKCNLDPDSILLVRAFLTACCSLKSITLSQIDSKNSVHQEEMLCCFFKNMKLSFRFLDSLSILNLSRNQFCDDFVPQLCDTLKEIKQLKELDLSLTNLTDDGLVCFANEYLCSSPKHLNSLTMSYNKLLDPEAAFHFGQGLCMTGSLRKLILKRMRIKQPVIAQLAKGFSAQLTHINLDNNKLSTEGFASLRRQILNG